MEYQCKVSKTTLRARKYGEFALINALLQSWEVYCAYKESCRYGESSTVIPLPEAVH